MTDDNTTKATIYVDIEDDIAAIISKIESADKSNINLVLPKRSSAMQSIVNMRLLKRSAESADKKIALVTSDEALLPLAGAAGLAVAKNLQSDAAVPPPPTAAKAEVAPRPEQIDDEDEPPSTKLDSERDAGRLAASQPEEHEAEAIKLQDEEAPPKPEPKKSLASAAGNKLKVPNFDSFRKRIGLTIFGFIALIIIFVLANKILPKATITFQTTSTPVSASFDLTASSKAQKVDLKTDTIPAVVKTSDKSSTQQVAATGSKNLGKKATGSVNLSGQTCAPNIGQPSTIPAGSAVTQGGKTYITQKDTVFSSNPNGGSGSCVTYPSTSSTPIAAQSPGSDYNVSSATFQSSGTNATGSGSTSGGTDNKVTVLSQSDVDTAVKAATSGNSKSLTDKFKQDVQDSGYYVIDSTLKAESPVVKATPAVGQQATTSSLSIKVTYSVLAVKKDDLAKVINAELDKQIDTTKQKISDSDVVTNADITLTTRASSGSALLSVSEKSTAVPSLDINSIKSQVAGHKTGDIQDQLSALPGVNSVNIHLSPFWVSKIPTSTGKIQIVFQQVSSPSQKSAP